jgi:hypothetical protein
LAWLLKFEYSQIKTVAINSGLKNVMMTFLVVNANFPSPELDYVLLSLVPALFQSSVPLKIIGLSLRIQKCLRKRKGPKEKKESLKEEKIAEDEISDSNMVEFRV